MYAWPVLLPATTNREDLLRTVSLFDDDTGEAFDFSGRTLAVAGDFTGNAWTVTCGTIITASVTPLTIKDYPFGNEMQALALTVGLGLGILAGSPVRIADATGLNTMNGYVTSYSPATGAMVCQIGSAFAFEIRGSYGAGFDSGYGNSSQIGEYCDSAPLITAQLGNMINVIDVGVVEVRIPQSQMTQLQHKTYGASMAMFDGADTRQLFIGKLPILSGGLSTNAFSAPSSNSNPYGLP
ncbi:MAG: hypothetical protein PS018_20265 [bacterium]|nr:hypothetical protein [bacterium]